MGSKMIKEDSVYMTLLKYDCDLFRGEKGITEYISDHLKQYYRDIEEATKVESYFVGETFLELLRGKLELLYEICEEIPKILDDYDQGFLNAAYMQSTKLFEKVKPYFFRRGLLVENDGRYYRIRRGDHRVKDATRSKVQKAELFHIKKEMRSKIGAYRYSVAGYPCLYLTSNIELGWFECGMPKQFSYCEMIIDKEDEESSPLIDFANRSIDVVFVTAQIILNARRRNVEIREDVYKCLLNYIITYPFAAVCSVKVKDRECNFVEEYIFPQLLMQWIRESDDIDGVCYKSSLNSNLVDDVVAVNVALPVKKFREDGLDENLTSKISVSDIEYIDVNKYFKKYKDILNEVRAYKNSLRAYEVESAYCGRYLKDFINVCECVMKTYDALMEGNYENSDLLFNHVGRLRDYATLMYQSREMLIQETINSANERQQERLDENEIRKQFEQFNNLMGQIFSEDTIFDFQFKQLENYEKI